MLLLLQLLVLQLLSMLQLLLLQTGLLSDLLQLLWLLLLLCMLSMLWPARLRQSLFLNLNPVTDLLRGQSTGLSPGADLRMTKLF